MRILLSILLLVFLTSACDNGFDALNENENQPTSVSPAVLLPNVIYETSYDYLWENWSIGNLVAQHGARITYGAVDRYEWDSGTGSLWSDFYGVMADVVDIETRAQQLGDPNYEAVALILKAWMIHALSDAWVDVPYTEAGRASDGIFQPKYDRQEDIYSGLLADLATANQLIDPNRSIEGDLIYGSDMVAWQKFANSLRLRILMRASNKRTDTGAAIQSILDDANAPIFESNADNAVYDFTGVIPNDSPVSQQRDWDFTRVVPSQLLMQYLLDNNDTRLLAWADPTDNTIGTDSEDWVGLPNGLSEEGMEAFNGGEDNVSVFDRRFLSDQGAADAILMTYAEVQFILAEAAQRGIISGDAQTYYEQGVTASFEQWGVEMPADYLTTSQAYDGSLEQIIEQKWLASFMVGLEAWHDFRRTGYPTLTPGPANVNNNLVPSRFIYPSTEQSLNTANYEEAVARLGGDNINIKGWWEDF